MIPKRGMRWVRPSGREARVMGVVDGYVVARLKGAMPFLLSVREWQAEYAAKHQPIGWEWLDKRECV